MKKTTLDYAEAFVKAIKDASTDECYCLNVGIHNRRIYKAWKSLYKNVTGCPYEQP